MSLVILIYRGLILGNYFFAFGFERKYFKIGTGDYNEVVIPVPIPNTEVKHFRGKNTLYGENSSLPVLNKSLSVIL